MLPEATWRIAEWIRLAVAIGGGLGFAGFTVLLARGKHRPRQAILGLAITVGVVGGMRWIGGELAVSRLCKAEELSGALSATPTSLSQRVVQWLEDNHIDVPVGLKTWASNGRPMENPPRMSRLVSYSRWPVRREFVKRMMTDEKHAAYLAGRWDECFPAVTGADVDLAHRRDLMEMFRIIHGNLSVSECSRQAASLWMGLVFLTDPVEFARWRGPIRDAMLGVSDPIQAEYHDCWMRVLDTLLAYDPPASWPVATEALISNPTTLRRAVRERVRGVMSHFDAVVREFEASERAEDWGGAFALWQDTGRWLAAYPGTSGEDRIRQWRRTTMGEWLTTDAMGTKGDHLFQSRERWVNLTAEDVMELAPDQEAVLHAKACDWADRAVALSENATASSRQNEAHAAMEHVWVLHPFLSRAHQSDLVRRLTPALIRPAVYTSLLNEGSKSQRFQTCDRCRRFLESSWQELAPEHLKTLVENSRSRWDPYGCSALILYFDAWSATPNFSDEEWLLDAIACGRIWKVLPPGTPKDQVENPLRRRGRISWIRSAERTMVALRGCYPPP